MLKLVSISSTKGITLRKRLIALATTAALAASVTAAHADPLGDAAAALQQTSSTALGLGVASSMLPGMVATNLNSSKRGEPGYAAAAPVAIFLSYGLTLAAIIAVASAIGDSSSNGGSSN